MPLTDKVILNAKPSDKEYLLCDGGGLYLRVKPNGKRLWRGYFQIQAKRLRMHLGAYPDMPLKKAREAVVAAKYQIAQGIDPKTNLDQRQQAILETPGSRSSEDADEEITIKEVNQQSPFRSLALAWFNHWKLGKAERHTKRTRNRLTDNLFPVLGSMPINDIEALDILSMVESIEERLGRGTELAQRSIQTASQIFRYGVLRKVAKRNPAADIKPKEILKPYVMKNQARVEEKDLPALLVAIDEYKGREVVKYALQLMILVFLRTTEMIHGVWSEIDYRENLWRIPPERMKGRAENKRPHLVPLSRQSLELLKKLKKITDGSENIFPGVYSKRGSIHDNSLTEALAELGYKGKQTGHGFRGVASTILHERGYNDAHIDIQLAHQKKNRVKAAYDHAKYLEPRRGLMQAWADYVDDALQRGYEERQQRLQAADAAD
jgi:integrase